MSSVSTKPEAAPIKLYPLAELVIRRNGLREAGQRVVFTNGCFDLLHPGHIRYLREARSLGDALIIAINSDRAVRELKGSSRPILNQFERAEVLAALEMVDFVTIFDELDPRSTIVALQPDVLVKGGDWEINQIIGREEVEATGGVVRSLPFVSGISTTDIVNRILKTSSDF